MYTVTKRDPRIFIIGIYSNLLYGFGKENKKLCIFKKSIFDAGNWEVFLKIDINVLEAQCCDTGLHLSAGLNETKIWIILNEKNQVFHIDPFSKKSLIGETQIKIEDYPWSEEDPIWLPLKKELIVTIPSATPDPTGLAPELPSRRGLLRFEISFKVKDPKKQRIDINFYAKRGNNLTGDPPILCKMPFVKANLLSNRKIISSARSSLAKFHGNGLEPCWNYNIVIQDQSLEKLKKRALEISIWDSSNNRHIGRLLFYLSDPKKQEKTTQSHWRRLIETPGAKFVSEL